MSHCNTDQMALAPPPPPPPPPPPMPTFDLRGKPQPKQPQQHSRECDLSGELGIDLVSPNGNIKPHMRMRTLNWRRIPKRRILSQQLDRLNGSATIDKHEDSISQMFAEMKISNTPKTRRSTPGDDQDETKTSSSDSDEETNIWFKIAKSNKTIRRFGHAETQQQNQQQQQQTDSSQDTITNSDNKSNKSLGSRPVSRASSKSASRIREMLESVRRRMAAVTAHSTPPPCTGSNTTDSLLPDAKTPVNGQSLLAPATGRYNLDSSLLLSSGQKSRYNLMYHHQHQRRPRNVIEAIDFHDLENLFCLNNQPAFPIDDDNSPSSFMRRASWRTNASSDSVISSTNNSYDSHLDPHQQHPDNAHHSLGSSVNYFDYDYDDKNHQEEDSFELVSENILDSKKSLNVNIFLKQLKLKNQNELIRLINGGDNKQLGEQRLETILKLLPDEQEQMQLMKFYTRNKQHRLPVAEKFLLQLLIRVPNLALRIKFMLVKEKYYEDIHEQIPQELDKIEAAVREIRKSRKFRDLLNLVLVTGNFLNSGGYAADAVGFSLDCLDRLQEVRSNRDGVYLIHYVAQVAQKMELVDFQADLAHVEAASRVCMESLKLDLVSMQEKIQELKNDIDNRRDSQPATSAIISNVLQSTSNSNTGQLLSQDQDKEFLRDLLRTLEDIKCNVDSMKRRLTVDLESIRRRLADYLCEDATTFNLHDCFCSILTFGQRLKVAADENERRQRLEAARNNKCSLKRSNTINPRLPPQLTRQSDRVSQRKSLGNCLNTSTADRDPTQENTNETSSRDRSRASFGGYLTSERRLSFMSNKQPPQTSRAMASPNLVRTSSTCSSMVKSSLSSLSSQATTSGNSSATNTSGDCDDLHDGLMRLLNESNSRRSSDIGAKIRSSYGGAQHHRRVSSRLTGQ